MPDRRSPAGRRTRDAAFESINPTAAPSSDDAAPLGGPVNSGEFDRLLDELRIAQAEAGEHLALLQRERAEFTNYRRRTTEEREREAGLAADYLLRKVITIADDFDRAIEAMPSELGGHAWADGIVAIDRKIRGLLESEGVRPIEALGKPFDPREHEAVASVPGTGRPDGEVVGEAQRGYRIRDRILRPALVAVAAADPGPPGAGHNGASHVVDDALTNDIPAN